MSAPFDLDGDWAVFDNVRAVSYVPFIPAADDYGTAVPNVDAFVTGHDKREVSVGEGEVHRESAVYHLRMSQLGGVTPTKRGKIIDPDGSNWTVESVQVQSWGTRARCEVVRY